MLQKVPSGGSSHRTRNSRNKNGGLIDNRISDRLWTFMNCILDYAHELFALRNICLDLTFLSLFKSESADRAYIYKNHETE